MNCPRCNAPNAETAKFCASCGQGLYPPAAAPPIPPTPLAMPLCPMCRSPYLQYFPNGKGTCATCRFIFGWGYLPNGQVVLYPNPGFTL